MRAIICGGRDYDGVQSGFAALDAVHSASPISFVIEGGARGADRIGREWARSRNLPFATVPADWDRHGRRAGYLRNRRMAEEFSPDIVLAFPGGAGTRMMIEIAKGNGIPVLFLDELLAT